MPLEVGLWAQGEERFRGMRILVYARLERDIYTAALNNAAKRNLLTY